MRIAVKLGVAASLAMFLAMFAGLPAAAVQNPGGSVTATCAALTPNPVASGQTATATLNATATPPTPNPYSSLSDPTWSWALNSTVSGVSISQLNTSSPVATLIAAITSPGVYMLSATATATWTDSNGGIYVASGTTAPITITVVGVQKLQYAQGGGYVDVSGTLYVLVGQPVTFKAVSMPTGSTYPAGQPVWSGSSGASGSGVTFSVAFNQLSASSTDYKSVTATCGNTSATANVIVFDLLPILTPQDNFAGRDLTAYGPFEYLNLSYQTTPPGIYEGDIGGLQWRITSGGGTLPGGAGGVATYQCPGAGAMAVLNLAVTGGLMLGLMRTANP
ncbi:MAG TPA: hypothetical protein DDY78_00445 [Planctomycetales bacterium]|jgi:hypothetical protein|nr:hypothetical protein [Planctomycetales bacterium]